MRKRAVTGAVTAGAAFVALAVEAGASLLGDVRLGLLGSALAAAALYDVYERRIPNRIVLPAIAACAALTFTTGAGVALVAGIAVAVTLVFLSLVRPDALGMGDAKLALLIVLGLDGRALAAIALGLAFAAFAGLALVASRGRAAWRASLPLAPFLAVGALIAMALP
jgi:leader peptidase (prepilin peptidase)/N-methyltransferase